MTSKYDPLRDHLLSREMIEVPMSFSDIEAVIGTPLPAKAARHPAWWSNNTSNNTMTKIWLDAGFRTERVDIGARRLVFRKIPKPSTRPGRSPQEITSAPAPKRKGAGGLLERARAALSATVYIHNGVDLTDPAGVSWDSETS